MKLTGTNVVRKVDGPHSDNHTDSRIFRRALPLVALTGAAIACSSTASGGSSGYSYDGGSQTGDVAFDNGAQKDAGAVKTDVSGKNDTVPAETSGGKDTGGAPYFEGNGPVCKKFPDGSSNRMTFTLGDIHIPQAVGEKVIFTGVKQGTDAVKVVYVSTTGANLGEEIVQMLGQQELYKDVNGKTIQTLDVCIVVGDSCNVKINPATIKPDTASKSGDTNCKVTIAADKGWLK